MSVRPAAGLLVSAMIRRTESKGGHAMVLAKGDAMAGAILVAIADRGRTHALIERAFGVDGYAWVATGPAAIEEPGALSDYIARRRRFDPDMWVVELDHPEAEAIVRSMMA